MTKLDEISQAITDALDQSHVLDGPLEPGVAKYVATRALEVMREPTFGIGSMTGAGAEMLPTCDDIWGKAGAISRDVYRAMIDAALEGK